MVAIMLDDKDAVGLLAAMDSLVRDRTWCMDNAAMARVKGQLRCALLLCDCSQPTLLGAGGDGPRDG